MDAPTSSPSFQPRFHWSRRATQFGMLLLLMLIPTLGLFRIDFATASFYLLGLQVEWTNYYFLLGLTLVIITAPIITYRVMGSLFCGWACPQNLFSELANGLTYKLLGKRASVRIDGPGMVVAASKNKAVNWLLLGLGLTAASAVLAYFFLMFFYTRSDMWNFVTGKTERLPSMIVMYWMTTFFIFIDIATVRYLYCDYPCLYRVWLRFFKPKDAIHVAFDATRSADCEKCNYCATSCITHIQPTNIQVTDTCVDCGVCIDACDRLHVKSGTPGLLSFTVGTSSGKITWRNMLGKAFSGMQWLVVVFFLAGCALMAWEVHATAQEIVDHKQLLLKDQEVLRVSRICTSQCASVQATCDGKHLAGCYRASACVCACTLQQEPASPSADTLRQCVRNNEARAQAADSARTMN
jgi:hypothetical protein